MIWLWLGFGAFVLTLLVLDLLVFHRKPHQIKLKEALGWTAVWVSIGLLFALPVYYIYEHHWFGVGLPRGAGQAVIKGAEAVMLYLTGYVLEESLSVDNMFVFAVIFTHFKVQPRYQHRILFWGIIGAVVMRTMMVLGGTWLLSRFDWMFYVFGGYLVYAGIKMFFAHKGEEEDPDKGWLMRKLRTVLPLITEDVGPRFFVRIDGKLWFTTLFYVLIIVELTDVVFAVDSVPAVLSITTDPFLVLTSNMLAILGLRALYFVLAEMIQAFDYLSHALSAILIFIGAKMMLKDWFHVPTLASLGVILLFLAAGIVASLLLKKKIA